MRGLRLLCLHGFRGSGAVLGAQLASAFPELAQNHELICPDAPSLPDGRSAWWNAVPSDGPDSSRKRYEGWQRTREAITAEFAGNGPFDGIFGFSQGAALAGLLVGLRAVGGVPSNEPTLAFRFAILVGGFKSRDAGHASLYAAPDRYALPSLHVIGRADRIVPAEASHELAACFTNPRLAEHDGGHVLASTPEVRRAVQAFLSGATLGLH